MTLRGSILADAQDAIVGDRNATYGSPADNFTRTASLINAQFGTSFTATDVGVLMVLLKVARLASGAAQRDTFVDIAGYAACAYEAGELT